MVLIANKLRRNCSRHDCPCFISIDRMRNFAKKGILAGLILFVVASKDSPFNQVSCDQGGSDAADWASLVRMPWSASISGVCYATFTIGKLTNEHHDVILPCLAPEKRPPRLIV